MNDVRRGAVCRRGNAPLAFLFLSWCLAACSGGAAPATTSPPGYATASAPTIPVATRVPTPTASAVVGPSLSNILVDEDGYRTKVEVSNMTVTTQTDIENQKPGYAQVSLTLHAKATFTNLTEGRKASIGLVEVLPAWRIKSPVCGSSTRRATPQFWQSVTVAGKNVWHDESTDFCAMLGVAPDVMKVGRLEPEESSSHDLDATRAIAPVIPEKSLASLEVLFREPDFWILLRPTEQFRSNGKTGACFSNDVFTVVDVTPGGQGFCVRVKTDK